MSQDHRSKPTVVITGMSGAGRSLALKNLEDLGFEAVDNLPLSLLAAVIEGAGELTRPLALGIDSRTRGFAVEGLAEQIHGFRAGGDPPLLVFLDCEDEVLARRFTETRRRHPLAMDRPVVDGISVERTLLTQLRHEADWVIDTSNLIPAQLRALLASRFGGDGDGRLTVAVVSFSYKEGLPREADLVFDARFLRNPYYQADLRPLDGRDRPVQDYIAADSAFPAFMADLKQLLTPLLPRYQAEGKSYLTLAVGCTGGQHRSVFIAELLSAWLAEHGVRASVSHRARERAAAATSHHHPHSPGVGVAVS